MKNNIMFSIICLVIIIVFAGCVASNISTDTTSNSDSIRAECYITDISNSSPDILMDYSPEYNPWNSSYFNSDSAKKSMSVEIDGTVYSGDYWRTKYQKYNSFATDIYHDSNGLEFGVKAGTNEWVYINFKTKDFFKTEPYLDNLENPTEQTLNIANACAEKYIDLSNYSMHISKPVIDKYVSGELSEVNVDKYTSDPVANEYTLGYHTFDYIRYINGIPTSDYLSVQVTSKGNIASIFFGNKDAFSEDKLENAAKFGNIDIVNLIRPKIVDSIQTEGIELNLYNVDGKYLAVSPNNEIVLCVRVACSFRSTQDKNLSYNAGVEMIVKLTGSN